MSSSANQATGPPANDHRWLILVIVAIAQLMVVLDATVVNIALPSAQRALGFPNGDRQWVVTAYALAFGSLLLLGGRLGDMFSRKWVFVIGLIGFAGSSAFGGAASSIGMLIAARTLQGVFGAILAPSALGTLVSTFQQPRERGKAFGVFGSVAAGGGAVGLILGGVLTEYLSWRWTLYVNLLFAAIAVAGALAYIPTRRPAIRPKMDVPGTLLASAGLFCIVYGFSHAETAGWTAPLTIGSLAAGVALLAAFAFAEAHVKHPLLPLRIIVDRTRGGAYVSVGVAGIAIFGVFLFLTYYLQTVKGYSPVTTGLAFLPMIACILVSSNTSSIVLLPRLGPRALIASGMLLGAVAMALLTRLTVTSSFAGDVLPSLLLLGIAFGLIISPAINTATAGVPQQDSGVASALVNTMQQVGGSIGTAALSTIALMATASYLALHHAGALAPAVAATHGYTVAFAVSAGLFGVGVVLAAVLLPSRQRLAQLRMVAAQNAAAAATPGKVSSRTLRLHNVPVAALSRYSRPEPPTTRTTAQPAPASRREIARDPMIPGSRARQASRTRPIGVPSRCRHWSGRCPPPPRRARVQCRAAARVTVLPSRGRMRPGHQPGLPAASTAQPPLLLLLTSPPVSEMPAGAPVLVVPYSPRWPDWATAEIGTLSATLGSLVVHADHFGSTSIPAMAAKDVLDIQLSVRDLAKAAAAFDRPLTGLGYARKPYEHDHVPAGDNSDPELWSKRYWSRRNHPGGDVNLHVRLVGSPNERLALLFRDYLRAYPAAVAAYSRFKLTLAVAVPELGAYTDIKDPVVDLVIAAAGRWARDVAWRAHDAVT
jgi:EmrB/QacA subfamily drug resistance transporter